jgi:DNA-binding NarL/FixJ family response regulator
MSFGECMARMRKQKILSIEPNRKTATAIAKELSDRGFKLSTAHDGQEGLVAILKEKPDLVLCDIDLPIMSGFELLERLVDIAPRFGRMPFVFMTRQTDRKHELEGRQLGADDYIKKPIDFDILAAIINARLAGVARTKVWSEHVKLNSREIEVLTFVARGQRSAQIATKLGIAKRTVDFHLDNARIKLGAATRAQAVVKAAAGGVIEP